MLVERLNSRGIKAIFNHEPTRANFYGALIRRLIEKQPVAELTRSNFLEVQLASSAISKVKNEEDLTELERQKIYMADRLLDLKQTILPAISRGTWVVQDRYEMSTFAFGATRGLSYADLKETQDEILGLRQSRGLSGRTDESVLGNYYLRPDVIFYFDLDPKAAVERLKASGKAVDIYETLPLIRKTRAAYKKLLKKKELYKSLYIIDAAKSIDKVFKEIVIKLNLC